MGFDKGWTRNALFCCSVSRFMFCICHIREGCFLRLKKSYDCPAAIGVILIYMDKTDLRQTEQNTANHYAFIEMQRISEQDYLQQQQNAFLLTHWGRVTYICFSDLTIIGSDNGLSPGRRQAIIVINAGILLIRPLGTNLNEILVEILIFLFKKMRLKVSSAKRRPFCLGLNVLSQSDCSFTMHYHSQLWEWDTMSKQITSQIPSGINTSDASNSKHPSLAATFILEATLGCSFYINRWVKFNF